MLLCWLVEVSPSSVTLVCRQGLEQKSYNWVATLCTCRCAGMVHSMHWHWKQCTASKTKPWSRFSLGVCLSMSRPLLLTLPKLMWIMHVLEYVLEKEINVKIHIIWTPETSLSTHSSQWNRQSPENDYIQSATCKGQEYNKETKH